MIQGSTDVVRDGVAGYVAHLLPALAELGIEAVVRQPTKEPLLHDVALVHVQFAPSAFNASGWLDALPRPLVTTLHEYDPHDRNTEFLVSHSAELIVTNACHARALQKHTGRTAWRIPLAPNVPDVGKSTARGEGTTVVFFGFVHPVKGTRYLIEAIARRPGLRLVVIGGFISLALPRHEAAAYRAELTAIARDLGAGGRVRFTGYLSGAQVSSLLHGADVAVLPFTAGVTTKSGALLSMLAHGLPTLVTAADDPDPELVDGDTVAVIPRRRSAQAVVETLDRVLGDELVRTRLSARGRQLAETRSWPSIARQHVVAYERVAGRA